MPTKQPRDLDFEKVYFPLCKGLANQLFSHDKGITIIDDSDKPTAKEAHEKNYSVYEATAAIMINRWKLSKNVGKAENILDKLIEERHKREDDFLDSRRVDVKA